MSISQAKEFINKMKSDKKFHDKLMENTDIKERMEYIVKAGFEFTVEDIKYTQSEIGGEGLDEVLGVNFVPKKKVVNTSQGLSFRQWDKYPGRVHD